MGLRITILLSLALLTRICAAQETVTVRGRVTRSDSGAPVEDANVMLCRSVTDLGGAQPPIHSLRQNAALNLSFAKSFFLRVGGEHYYNDAVRGDRSMFFLDASLSWRMKRLELALECRNLLGTETYSSASYSDITTYVYTYRLRPLTALLKIRFTL